MEQKHNKYHIFTAMFIFLKCKEIIHHTTANVGRYIYSTNNREKCVFITARIEPNYDWKRST